MNASAGHRREHHAQTSTDNLGAHLSLMLVRERERKHDGPEDDTEQDTPRVPPIEKPVLVEESRARRQLQWGSTEPPAKRR